MYVLGVLISGRGSNLQSIIDAVRSGQLDATVAVVISNRADAAGLRRARGAGIETVCLQPHDHADRDAYDRALVQTLCDRRVDLVCLAGFMRIVGPALLEAFPNRILIEDHRLYVEAIRMMLEGRWSLRGRRFMRTTV